MASDAKRFKPYEPRKRKSEKEIALQTLMDFQRQLSADVGTLLVLTAEGSPSQITYATQRAKSHFIKLGPEMQKLAEKIGSVFPKTVAEFLDSVDSVIHSATGWIDDAKVTRVYQVIQKLQDELKAAA